MNPHRPVDLDSFNRDFFSSGEEKTDSPKAENKVFTAGGETGESTADKSALSPALTAEVIDALMKLKVSSENPVFHSFPEDEEDTPAEEKDTYNEEEGVLAEKPAADTSSAKSSTGVTEQEALESFPDFDFDPTIFEAAQESDKGEMLPEDNDDSQDDDDDEEFFDSGNFIREEKKKIKAQKKLEKKIQRPFKSRRLLTFVMIIMIIVGLVAAAVSGLLYETGNTPESSFDVGNYSFCYIDGVNIQSSEVKDGLVLISKNTVTSTETILYRHNDETRIETIIAVGDNSYGIRYEGNPLQVIQAEEIEGIVIFSINGIKPVYDIAHYKPAVIFGAVFGYLAAVIILFSVLISVRNKKIKKYRESYQLVS